MDIPQPDNVSSVLVDGQMWSTRAQRGVAGWATPSGIWLDVPAFRAYLDSAHMVTFYSPTGRIIEPEE